MRRTISLLLIPVALLVGSACSRPPEQPASKAAPTESPTSQTPGVKYHRGRGRVVDVDAKGRYIVIRHEEIKDFMEPMTMPFHLESPALAKSVRVGDQVEFTLKETPDGVLLAEIRKQPGP